VKRVLNSCSIKLPYIKGTETEVLGNLPVDIVCRTFQEYLFKMEFKFEVKAPLLTFLDFQDAHLGTLNRLKDQDHQIAYLPSEFYTQNDLTYNIMDSKACNVHFTKLNNFFEWSFNFYNKLRKEGMCEEQAKLVLPQGIFVNFLWDVNALDLIKFIDGNWNKSPEMYGYCSTFVLYLEEHLPLIIKWYKQNRWQDISL
jgi:hypothetical protein